MRRNLALVACFAVTASLAHAAPSRHARRHGNAAAKVTRQAKVAPPVAHVDPSDDEGSDATDDEAEEPRRTKRSKAGRARTAPAHDDADSDSDPGSPRRSKADRTRTSPAHDDAEDDDDRAQRSKTKRARILPAHDDAENDDDGAPTTKRARTLPAHERAERDRDPVERSDGDSERVAVLEEDVAVDRTDAPSPAVVRKATTQARPKQWHVAIGPYLWASAVDAKVSLGSASLSAGIDFLDITRHARYGVPLVAEVRYGRFSVYGDLLFGVVDVSGAREVGPLMVTLAGTASTLLADGIAGVMLAGGEHSVLSLEARTGVRYQRTAISAAVDVSGSEFAPPNRIDAAADVLAGAQAVVRPFGRLSLSGTFDLGVLGASTNNWSLSTDANLRVSKYVRLALGWRTLTTERANVSLVMHGPRAAVQVTF